MKFFVIALMLIAPLSILAQAGEVLSVKSISAVSGNFSGLGNNIGSFGKSVCNIGDLDKDGVNELAVGAYDEGPMQGNIFILFMNNDFTVKSYVRIGPNIGGLNGTFSNMSEFGGSITTIADLDNDDISEIAVGNRIGGTNNTGQVFIIFLNADGTVKKYTIIGSGILVLNNSAEFGASLAAMGDMNADGIDDIAVGAPYHNAAGAGQGSVFILFMNQDGLLNGANLINTSSGGFGGNIDGGLGYFMNSAGDHNKDGIQDLIVSSDHNFSSDLWLLFLDTPGVVKSFIKIAGDSSSYTDTIRPYDSFGWAIASLGDIDGDDINDIAVSSIRDSVNGVMTGRVRIISLQASGQVKSIVRIDNYTPLIAGMFSNNDFWGSSLSGTMDLDGNFKTDLIAGASGKDEGGQDKGAIYLLSMDGVTHPVLPDALWKVNTTSGNKTTIFQFTQYSSGYPSSFKWTFTPSTISFVNGTSDTSANPTVKFNNDGEYTVQLNITNPFGKDSLIRSDYISIATTGLEKSFYRKDDFIIYPNPSSDQIYMDCHCNIKRVIVYDVLGKAWIEQINTVNEMNVAHFPSGTYTIEIEDHRHRLMKARFIVNH